MKGTSDWYESNMTELLFYALYQDTQCGHVIIPMAIAEMAKIALLAIMPTIVMANVEFSMALGGFKLKSKKNLAHWF